MCIRDSSRTWPGQRCAYRHRISTTTTIRRSSPMRVGMPSLRRPSDAVLARDRPTEIARAAARSRDGIADERDARAGERDRKAGERHGVTDCRDTMPVTRRMCRGYDRVADGMDGVRDHQDAEATETSDERRGDMPPWTTAPVQHCWSGRNPRTFGTMKFGIATFVTDEGISPLVLGPALEERGFDSLFLAEHSHIPTSRQTPYPSGGDLPRKYYRTLDPFVALTAMASVTNRLLVGTGIALLPQRDVIHLAKEVASVDLVSDGRFQFGVGVGWNREEMRNHGTDPKTRGALVDEMLGALIGIWTSDEAEFHGSYLDFDPIFAWPKPVQRPHPPIYVGGESDAALARLARFGDAWFPRSNTSPEKLREVRRWLTAQGLPDVPFTIFGAGKDPAKLAGYADGGVERITFLLETMPESETLAELDVLAQLLCQWPVCGPRFWPGESPHPCGSSSGFQGRPPGVVVSCEVEGRLRCRGRCSSTDRLRAGCPGRNVVTRNWRGCNETCAGISAPARKTPRSPSLRAAPTGGHRAGRGYASPDSKMLSSTCLSSPRPSASRISI